jgi:PKD repeat protein
MHGAMKAKNNLAGALISASVLIMAAVTADSAPHATVPGAYLDDFARTTLLVPSQGATLSDGNILYWNQTGNGTFSIQDSVLIAQYNATGFYRFATASSTSFAYCIFRIKGDSRAKNNQIYTRIAGQPGSDTLGISDKGGVSERELDTLVGPDSLPVPAITGQFQTIVVDMKKNGLSFGGTGNSNAFQIGAHAPMELDIDYIFMSNTNPLAASPPANLTYKTNPVTCVAGAAITPDTAVVAGAVDSFSVTPALPAKLSLARATGIITGTPTAAQAAASYTVTARNTAGFTTVSLSITVAAALAPPAGLTYSTNPAFYVTGTAIAANSPTSSGGAVASYAVAPELPAGLTLSPTTGIITGTPTMAQAAANYTVSATNAAGSAKVTLSIAVAFPPPKAYFTASPATGRIPLTVTFTDSSIGVVSKRYWYFGDNTALDSSASPTHTYATEGSFSATLVVFDGSGNRADSAVVVIRTYKDNPVLISGRMVSPGKVAITYTNYNGLPVGPLPPPFSDSIALWYGPTAIPLSRSGATNAKNYLTASMETQGKGAPITDTITLAQPLTDTVYGFVTAVHWNDGTWSAFATGNGCLVPVKDTSTPVNACLVRGKYLGADLAAVVVDGMKSIDTSSVDSVGVWCGSAATDTAPDFGNVGAATWYRTQDLSAAIAATGKDSIVIVNGQFNSGVVKTIWCAVVLKGKNGKYSGVVKASFPVGVDRPGNPLTALSAQAQSASRISLSWPAVSGVDALRIVYRADTAVPLNIYYFDTTRYFVASPAVTDTAILVTGLRPTTHYYFGAQVYKNGLWSVVTQNASADAVTPLGNPALDANRIKLDSLSFDTATNRIKVFWKAAGASLGDSLQVKVVYSPTGYPDSTQAAHDPSKPFAVLSAKDTVVMVSIPNLLFNTKYYVSLWESRIDGALTAATDSSQGAVTSPNYNWQSVTYFTQLGGDTAYAFNANIRIMTDSVVDSASVVRITDKVLFVRPDTGFLAGFVPASIAFKFANPQSSARFYVGLKLLPLTYPASSVRVYRLQDSAWAVESTFVVDTQAGYISVKTNNLPAVFMALVDTVPVTATAESHASVAPEFSDLYDTITVSDNIANVKYQFMCAKGGDGFAAGSVTGQTLGKRSAQVVVHIPPIYVTGDNGVRARFTATDGVHVTVVDLSRRVRRANSDYVKTDPLKWEPLRVTAVLDSPQVRYALREMGDTSKPWTYDAKKVRLFKWYPTAQNAASDRKWVEYSDNIADKFDFQPGGLTWIKTRDGIPVSFGSGITLPLDSSYSIPIAPNTWTDIALPYKFNVKVGDILDSTATGTLNADSLRIYSWQRDSTGLFRTQPLYISELGVAGLADKTATVGCLDLTGYAIFNPLPGEQVTLRVPAIPEAMSKYGQTPQPLPKKARKSAAQGWAIKVVSGLESGSRLTDVYCAYDPSKAGPMRYYPLSPALEQEYVGVCDAGQRKTYGHALTGVMTSGGCAYMVAFVNESQAVVRFVYHSETVGPMPGTMKAKFYDETSGQYEDTPPNASISVGAGSTGYRWLFVGTEGYLAKAPVLDASALRLIGTSPNPFRGAVRIRYCLPPSGIETLKFTICNLRGAVVWRWAMDCHGRGGAGGLTWNAGSQAGHVAAGTYVLRMSALDEKGRQCGVFERKMTLLP